MKHLILAAIGALTIAAPAFSQKTSRSFENSASTSGVCVPAVQMQRPVDKRSDERPAGRFRHYPASPLTGDKYKNSIAGTSADAQPAKVTREAPDTTYEEVNIRYIAPAKEKMEPLLAIGKSLNGMSTGDRLVDSYIVASSFRYRIDPLLIYAQMHTESAFKQKATSHKGASGLMQLMPGTARRLGVTNIYDPKQNINGGVKYMRMLLDMFGQNLNLALAGYNAGEGAVMKYGYQIPPYKETRDYVRRISSRYKKLSGIAIPQSDLAIVPSSSPAREFATPDSVRDSVRDSVKDSVQKVPPPPSGWESGTEMLRRYAGTK